MDYNSVRIMGLDINMDSVLCVYNSHPRLATHSSIPHHRAPQGSQGTCSSRAPHESQGTCSSPQQPTLSESTTGFHSSGLTPLQGAPTPACTPDRWVLGLRAPNGSPSLGPGKGFHHFPLCCCLQLCCHRPSYCSQHLPLRALLM